MPFDNYTNLKTAIGNWLARPELDGDGFIDDFIDLTEAEFNRTIRSERMLAESSTITTSSTTSFATLPTDFLQIDNLSFESDPRNIEFVTTKQLRQTRSGQANQANRPKAFTIVASSTSGGAQRLLFGNSPDSIYTFTLSYYQQIPALSTSNTTNWLLTNYPGAYLYGSLKQGLGFIQDTDRRAEITANYNQIIAEIEKEDENRKFGGAGSRVITDVGNP